MSNQYSSLLTTVIILLFLLEPSFLSVYYANILLYLLEPTFLSVYYANIRLYLLEPTFLSVKCLLRQHSDQFNGINNNIPLC
jgi:hypothetical protein